MTYELPLMRMTIFAALKILSEISLSKKVCPLSLVSAFRLSGLTRWVKVRLKVTAPREKKRMAKPETLLRWLGNCDHRQFRTGTEPIDMQETGKIR